MSELKEVKQEERTWAVVVHLIPLVGLLIPFGSIIAPLVVWLIKKNESPFVDHHGKEALNFQITMAIAGIICFILSFIFIGILLAVILVVYWIVMMIMAALKASEGQEYRYPISIRFIS